MQESGVVGMLRGAGPLGLVAGVVWLPVGVGGGQGSGVSGEPQISGPWGCALRSEDQRGGLRGSMV